MGLGDLMLNRRVSSSFLLYLILDRQQSKVTAYHFQCLLLISQVPLLRKRFDCNITDVFIGQFLIYPKMSVTPMTLC